MGLDMYLSGKRYLSSYFVEGDDERANAIAEQFPELEGKQAHFGGKSCVKEVTIEVGYWRKANQIHKWFVDNVQGGEDKCRPHRVDREQLEELRDLCKQGLEDRSKASELLPPTAGFLFGSTDVDKYYFQDLEQTVKIIDEALKLPASWEFEYCSSW